MNRLAFGALWLLVFTIPWENSLVLGGLGTIARAIGMLAAGLTVLAVLARGRLRRPEGFHRLVAALVLWVTASAFWSIEPPLTAARIGTMVQLGAMVWMLWELGREEGSAPALMEAYVWGAWVGVLGTFHSYLFDRSAYDLRYVAAGFDPNDLGLTLCLAVPMAWTLGTAQAGRLRRALLLLYVPAAAVAVLLTASRGSFLSMAVALSIVPWSMPRVGWKLRAACGLLLVAGILGVQTWVPTTSWDRLATIGSELGQQSVGNRVEVWRRGLERFADSPVLGVGAGAFGEGILAGYGRAAVAHNLWVGVLAELGLVGFALLAAILLAVLGRVRALAPVERRMWLVLLATWGVGTMALSWQARKPTWLLLGLAPVHAAALRASRREAELDLETESDPELAGGDPRPAPQPA